MEKNCVKYCSWLQQCEREKQQRLTELSVEIEAEGIVAYEAIAILNATIESAQLSLQEAGVESVISPIERVPQLIDRIKLNRLKLADLYYARSMTMAIISCRGLSIVDRLRLRNQPVIECNSANVAKTDKEVAFKKFA